MVSDSQISKSKINPIFMCGICGQFKYINKGPTDRELLQKMLSTLSHRGPDDEGVHVDGFLGIGMRRLSIIDLKTGHQPLSNEDESLWLVLNGEIYNHRQLRSDLSTRGHRFKTSSDAEVVLHLYEEFGYDALEHLRGMFAFAIWDKPKERLFVARDRVGKKPLVYSTFNNTLIFASELKAILQDPQIPKIIDNHAIDQYLSLQYIPHPLTIFKDIKKLPPGHYMVCEKGTLQITPYWQIDYSKKSHVSEKEHCHNIIEGLKEAVALRLESDVPVGAFLSGGLDSSAIVALMAEISGKKIKTYSIGFDEKQYDETPFARIVANKFDTDHHEFTVRPDFFEILDLLTYHYDEPFADGSAIPSLYVSKIAASHVKVVLNGDGGDESFGGYSQYKRMGLAPVNKFLPERCYTNALHNVFGLDKSSWMRDWYRRIYPRLKTFDFRDYFTNDYKNDLYNPDFNESVKGYHMAKVEEWTNGLEKRAGDELDKMLCLDMDLYIPCNQMYKTDIASMTFSLEARSPFLDHKLLEYSATIPSELKTLHKTTKYILKKAFQERLPKEIVYRSKQGLDIPLGKWFRGGAMMDFAKKSLVDESVGVQNFFNISYIDRLIQEHVCGKANNERRIWALLIFELWHRKYCT